MAQHHDTTDINDKLVCNFRDIGHTIRHIAEGRGSQKRILVILQESGAVTQRELTQKLRIQPGSASEVIGKLEAAGLILRTPSQADHRTVDITLTDAGRAAAEEIAGQREKRHEQMFACLSEEEKEQLLGLLTTLNASWHELYPDSGSRPGRNKKRD